MGTTANGKQAELVGEGPTHLAEQNKGGFCSGGVRQRVGSRESGGRMVIAVAECS